MVRVDMRLVSVTWACLLLLLDAGSLACTGRSSKQTRGPRESTPLTLRQRVPNVSENTLGASGPAEGRIHRTDPKFDELLPPNTNTDILFKDEEGTGADRRMTKRCKDKLNSLAISVMNQWPGVSLRVTEAWDEDGHHDEDSLHYEGRAVDITTSDKDRAKYGMLARLAVDAGFDWVSFESKTWVHCSVKADSSEAAKSGGCFPADSTVSLKGGETRTMSDLRIGDRVQVVDRASGRLVFSEVLAFLDRRPPSQETVYHVLETDRPGRTARLTAQHVLYAADSANTSFAESRPLFASDVQAGQYLYTTVHDHDRADEKAAGRGRGRLVAARVASVSRVVGHGAVAPLTEHGTVVVDGVAASTYAVLDVDWLAHAVFAPVRWWHRARGYWAGPAEGGLPASHDIHWYPALMYRLSKPLIGSWYHPEALDV